MTPFARLGSPKSSTGAPPALLSPAEIGERIEEAVGRNLAAQLNELPCGEVAAGGSHAHEGDVVERVSSVADLVGPHGHALVDQLARGRVDGRELIEENT